MVEGGPGGRLCPIRLPYYDTTLCTTSIFHGEQTSFVGSLGPQNCRTLFFDLHLFYHLFKKCHPKAWVPPFLLDFSFYLLPFLERIKCFFIQRANASLLGSGKPRGVAKSEDSDPRWGRGLRSITAPPPILAISGVFQLTQNMTLKPKMKYLMQQLTSGPL
jgi:hypothetical protein